MGVVIYDGMMEQPGDSSPGARDAQPGPAIDGLPALWNDPSSDSVDIFLADLFPAEGSNIFPNHALSQQLPPSRIAASASNHSIPNTKLTSQPATASTRYIPQSPHSEQHSVSAWRGFPVLAAPASTTAWIRTTTATVGATYQPVLASVYQPTQSEMDGFSSAQTQALFSAPYLDTFPQLSGPTTEDDTLPLSEEGSFDPSMFTQNYDVKFDANLKPDAWFEDIQQSSSGAPSLSIETLAQYATLLAPIPDSPRQIASSSIPVFGPPPPPRPANRVQKKSLKKSATKALDIVLYDPKAVDVEEKLVVDGDPGAAVTAPPLKHTVYEYADGKVGGVMTVFGNRERRRSRFTPEKRRETNMARKEGVCRRCQSSKRKVRTHVSGIKAEVL